MLRFPKYLSFLFGRIFVITNHEHASWCGFCIWCSWLSRCHCPCDFKYVCNALNITDVLVPMLVILPFFYSLYTMAIEALQFTWFSYMSFLFEYVLNIKFVITGDNLKDNKDKYVTLIVSFVNLQVFNYLKSPNTNGLAQCLVFLLSRREIAEFSNYFERRS
jgi:hypothetical protein